MYSIRAILTRIPQGYRAGTMGKVLLVADAAWVVNEVKSSLSLGGWDIEVTSDPRKTIDLVTDTEPQVVIVDMQVGSMGGMAVIRAIRGEIDDGDRPRLVLLLDRSADRFLAGRAGADACVAKPINAADLRGAIVEPSSTADKGEEE